MTVSVGGMSLMSLRNPFSELLGMVLGKTDPTSLFCLLVFFIVIFVLAYLTNPSENSFRAYLTEQSFRQHLSRLDVTSDDDHKRPVTPNRRTSYPAAHTPFDNSSTFHFANKASVSLRTPKHVFHSFGIFTIAAMVPLAKSTCPRDRENMIISDSWYIGAFGRWWRGGVIEAWYHDVIARTKDEESWSSGILSMKNLDRLSEYNGLPFSTKNLPPHLLSRGSPPRLRNRERPSHRPAILPARSSTPPPLPKSASLPLHTARLPTSASDGQARHSQPAVPIHTCAPSDQVRLGSPLIKRSPSTLFDQSPSIAEVLRQISHSRVAISDLRTQLSDCQSCASQSHGGLQAELESFRERKRQDDASKLEIKSRTKSLDDSKRATESQKRDAEKKLKAAQTARDKATQRIDHLDQEIGKLRQRHDDLLTHQQCSSEAEAEMEVMEALEHKRNEIKVAEDVFAALNQRARDLELKLTEHKERLAIIKERNETRLIETGLAPYPGDSWTNAGTTHDSQNVPSPAERHVSSATYEALNSLGRRASITVDTAAQPIGMSRSAFAPSPTQAYSGFDDAFFSVEPQQAPYLQHSTFSPFGDMDAAQIPNVHGVVSPTSQSLIPSALITSLESAGLPRSFQSESDAFLDRSEWRNNHNSSRLTDGQDSGSLTLTHSPVSPRDSINSMERDSFEGRFQVNESDYVGDFGHEYLANHHSSTDFAMDLQRASWLRRASSDPQPGHHTHDEVEPKPQVVEKAPRRWFSKDKAKKGLNPDAKVFSLPGKPSPPRSLAPAFNISTSGQSFDALNPTSLNSNMLASATSSFTRAFAPSPAEREALKRALGGSANPSLERLPSLSDVGSIPSSPSHAHALPAVIHQHAFSKILPAWLQSLPPRKATNFSPWDDEEPESSGSSSAGKLKLLGGRV
ncbi:hypothetical protein H0H92_014653 [Tricholoma furcatifolium]|nr:hypothetical protein H0H92_014653 [Tricholoma furcatifolium]